MHLNSSGQLVAETTGRKMAHIDHISGVSSYMSVSGLDTAWDFLEFSGVAYAAGLAMKANGASVFTRQGVHVLDSNSVRAWGEQTISDGGQGTQFFPNPTDGTAYSYHGWMARFGTAWRGAISIYGGAATWHAALEGGAGLTMFQIKPWTPASGAAVFGSLEGIPR